MPSYLTLATTSHVEPDPIKGSRFIGDACPVHNEEEARAFVERIAASQPSAHHHCYAWRLEGGEGGARVEDDGEPGGTAGKPILMRIDGRKLRGIVVVVTRYFGGTKLGKGGLVRAYGGTAGLALDDASILEVQETLTVTLRLGYEDQSHIMGALHHFSLTPTSRSFEEIVTLTAEVPVEDIDALSAQVRDRTAGRVEALWIAR